MTEKWAGECDCCACATRGARVTASGAARGRTEPPSGRRSRRLTVASWTSVSTRTASSGCRSTTTSGTSRRPVEWLLPPVGIWALFVVSVQYFQTTSGVATTTGRHLGLVVVSVQYFQTTSGVAATTGRHLGLVVVSVQYFQTTSGVATTTGRHLGLVVNAELSMGPFCVTRSNPSNQLTDPTQPNPLEV